MNRYFGLKTWVRKNSSGGNLPQKSGVYELFLEDVKYRFAFYIPEGYDKNRLLPLILVLHWGGPTQPRRGEAILGGLALPALFSLGAFIVAPDCPDENWETDRSERFVLDLLDLLQRTYRINDRQCLITGYSMGARGTWYLAARNQNSFCAAIPVSATPPEGMEEIDWNIPLHVIHSNQDEHFPLKETQRVVEMLQGRGVDIEMLVVDGITHFNVTGFVEPLQGAVPWIKLVWSRYNNVISNGL